MRGLPTVLCLAMLLLAVGTAGAETGTPLGRLFLTPEQRAQIDARRHDGMGGSRADDAGPAAGDRLVMNGLLQGSDGRQRLWVNGRGADPRRPGTPFVLLRDGRVRVHWDGAARVMKPGQVLDPVTGEITELFAQPADAAGRE